VFVEEALLDRSVNAALVRAGLAYAELYSTMPFPLIGHMQDLVTQARAAGAGFWSSDRHRETAGVPGRGEGPDRALDPGR
jgi:endonuclease YncB( thermonuclease family)